jgi:hypothetical protein
VDYLETPGSEDGFSFDDQQQAEDFLAFLGPAAAAYQSYGWQALTNAIFSAMVQPGQHLQNNNFSELVLKPETPVPPVQNPPPEYRRPDPGRELFTRPDPLRFDPLIWAPLPLIVGAGPAPEMTWHLSIVNGGMPRGAKAGQLVSTEKMEDSADHLNYRSWTVRGMRTSNYRYISTAPISNKPQSVFSLPGAKPLMGDFNGDGLHELALFLDGEWFIDINGNGKWDEEDIWLKLGTKGDQPVVGDWDGDGKDDAGIFGKKWVGDDRALAAEPGIPDPDNFIATKRPKNVPRDHDETPESPRLMQPSRDAAPRADVIDHVFRMGSNRDIAVSGDFNGDGVSTVGTFRDGKWKLDFTGDGKPEETIQLGKPGDLPLVGDFDGDGVDELAVVRGNRVLVDTNNNGRFETTDQVFMLESAEGTIIVGDFDGDGQDEPALYQVPEQQRNLQARRSAG